MQNQPTSLIDLRPLQRQAGIRRLVVALSGGCDSMVMLHSLVAARAQGELEYELVALHINHGLQAAATEFESCCRDFCESHRVAFFVEHVTVSRKGSLETNARQARYDAFESFLSPTDLLLMAHHLDDQIETALFRLFRGSRVEGLQGMPVERPVGTSRLFRPMLERTRQEIEQYAETHRVRWIQDPSNQDLSIDRNWLRHRLLPEIEGRWPEVRSVLAKQLVRDALTRKEQSKAYLSSLDKIRFAPDCLQLGELRRHADSDIKGLIDAWLISLGLPVPGGKALNQLVDLIRSNQSVLLQYEGIELRQYKNDLFVLKPLPERTPLMIDLVKGIDDVATPDGRISNKIIKGAGLRLDCDYYLRYRAGAETMHIRHDRTLKNIFQEESVPVWLRDRVPLVFCTDELVAIAAIPSWGVPMLIADGWGVNASETGLNIALHLQDRFNQVS